MEKYFFILNILLLKLIKTQYEKCIYSFYCQKDNMENVCLKKEKTNSEDIYNIILNNCHNSSCNIYNALIGDKEKEIKCQASNLKFKRPSYPKGTCIDNNQCLSGICINSTCINYNLCSSHEDCPLNTFCYNGKCNSYLKDNDNCSESYQCKFNSFCHKKEKKCKKLFFFNDGVEITEYINENVNNIGEICQSGGYISVKTNQNETRYYCETLFNENITCKNKCTYKRQSNNEYITLEDKCLCGYNKYRTKYCVLGNGQKEFKDYLRIRKNFLFNENYVKKCHTLERDSNDICNELININNSVSFREFIQNYTNLKIIALDYHRIKDSEDCIKEIIFGYNTNPIIPLKQSCPKYICDTNIKPCLLGINEFNEEGNNITIKLNNNICAINEQCSINKGILASNDIMDIMDKKIIEGKCSIYYNWSGIRYPGEKCNIDIDCIDNSKCENGFCTGYENGENCTSHSQCKVGAFCNKNTLKCMPQKKEGEQCVEGWDCQNFLGCYRGRCNKLGILKPGVLNDESSAPFPGNEKRYYLCNTGELDGDDGITGNYCVKSKYSDIWINEYNKKVDGNGFIKCEYNEICFYDNGKKTIAKKCGCGYNSDGQGYCPLPSSLRMDEWNNKIQYIANLANNNCHTLSRFNCYTQNSLEIFINKKQYDKKTVDAHLFYNAVPCAEKMFAFNIYLEFHILSMLLLYILIYL